MEVLDEDERVAVPPQGRGNATLGDGVGQFEGEPLIGLRLGNPRSMGQSKAASTVALSLSAGRADDLDYVPLSEFVVLADAPTTPGVDGVEVSVTDIRVDRVGEVARSRSLR